jgi:hypothetical protein
VRVLATRSQAQRTEYRQRFLHRRQTTRLETFRIGQLDESPDETEVLVEVTLPDPGDDTWSREMTSKIRTAVRTATSEVMPWAVATTRLVPPAVPDA